MQPAFDRSTPVVDFGATSRPFRWGPRRWVLWPAFAFKVLMPAQRNSSFNILQRAVIDLCRAGVRSPVDIAARLAFQKEQEELVGFILQQLREMGILDDGGVPTQRALRLLAEEEDPAEAEDAGYVLVDGHSLRLWPRIHRGSLPFVDAEFESGRSARFKRGTQGTPESVSATILWPSSGVRVDAPPTSLDILKAARRHQRRARAFARETSRADVGDFDPGFNQTTPRRFRLVSRVAEPVFVAAYVFVTTDKRQQSWLVTEPCGLGVTDVLRGGLSQLAKEGKPNVRELLEDLTGEAWHVDENDLAHYLAEAHRFAAARIDRQLGAGAGLLPPDVVQRLADADERLDAARIQSGATTKLIEDFLANTYAALEGVFGWLVSLYPDPSLLSVLATSGDTNGQLLQRVANELGFTTSDDTFSLLRVSRAVVKGAICNGNRSLPGRLAAALLAAQNRSDHALRFLATRDASALEFLAYLGKLRIDASHNTSSVPTVSVASDARDRLFEMLRALVGAGPALDIGAPQSDDLAWGADLLLRLRARAERCTGEYPGIDEYPELRNRLIDMHHAALLVSLLARSGDALEDGMRTRLRDFAVAASIALEAALAEVERLSPCLPEVAAAISDDRNENASTLIAVSTDIGFQLAVDGTLPAVLTHARPDRVRRAAHGEAETLSARLMAQILSAARQPTHPLREVARRNPAFLMHVGQVVAARGHGDVVAIDAASTAQIENTLREDLRALLAALEGAEEESR